jgi:hypothetical protein
MAKRNYWSNTRYVTLELLIDPIRVSKTGFLRITLSEHELSSRRVASNFKRRVCSLGKASRQEVLVKVSC